mmetsp:Transcript_6359/g.15322  ORF Transcript_6359/g.15322 Transcript_6359/m.15322 type:complete len:716 (+) Transcript_6359:29-2176(+)
MGACVNRDDVPGPTVDDTKRSEPSRKPHQPGVRVEVVFALSRLPLSITHQATKALISLLHAGIAASTPVYKAAEMNQLEGRKRMWLSQCVSALQALLDSDQAVVRDMVAPIVNVMLQTPDSETQRCLWQSVVLHFVKMDSALAHLFYWAFRSAAASSEADEHTLKLAQQWRDQMAALLRQKFSKSDRGAKVSTLVDLLDAMTEVGEGIVQVQSTDRNAALQERLQALNAKLDHRGMVPVHVVAPRMAARGARVVSVLGKESFVLASKERAPFQVLLEVELLEEAKGHHPSLRSFPWCCRRRASQLRNVDSGRRPPPQLTRADSLQEKDAPKPLRAHSTPSLGMQTARKDHATSFARSRLHPSTHQLWEQAMHQNGESRASMMRKSTPVRPKGLFKTESWDELAERVRRKSKSGSLQNWAAVSLILKSNADDVRQEELAYRLLMWFQRLFQQRGLKLWLMPFTIIATGPNAGVLETLPNAISLDALKKSHQEHWKSLREHFEDAFPKSQQKKQAIDNFAYSMAGYSVVSYVLAIRDRHNGNILLDDEGHIIHVDFGFMLCGAPGGKALQRMGGFEHSRGFKLTSEFVDVLGGQGSAAFETFREAVIAGLEAVRQEAQDLLAFLQLNMLGAENYSQRCFQHPAGCPEAILDDICARLRLPASALHVKDKSLPLKSQAADGLSAVEFREFAADLVDKSVDHWRSRLYDDYQRLHNGIL